ncbi:uncharacterized protein LOC128883408 [Hylaeus volcanicus]|uniref:uncharacterized protein LOC128883408 n=1 Tax=Hylaeus volcanicus TaxID=313075 RepID=UPI0023B876F5|nr:uncharacterized protein LOC128883408 [Hylaeus volcanicus]
MLPTDLDDAHLIQHLMNQDYGFVFSYNCFHEKNIYLRLHLLSVTMGDLLIERLQHRKKLKNSLSFGKETTEKPTLNITHPLLLSKTNEHIQICINILTKMCSDTRELSELPSERQENNKEIYRSLIDMVMRLHKEYSMRYTVIQKRFDITIQSFLWTKNLKTPLNIYEILQPFVELKNKKECPYITLLDIIVQGHKAWEEYGQNSQKKVEPCFLRSLKIGQVESRGGIPENYSNNHVQEESRRANRSMSNLIKTIVVL